MEFKECRTCGELLEINKDNFYVRMSDKGRWLFTNPDCKECYNEKEREARLTRKLENEYGADRVISMPNKYADDIQKQQTFQFLTLMGWKFNEEKGIWYDDIKKTKDGEFIGVWAKRIRSKTKRKKIQPNEFVEYQLDVSDYKRPFDINELLRDYYVHMIDTALVLEKYNINIGVLQTCIRKYKQQLGPVKFRKRKPMKGKKQTRKPVYDYPKMILSKKHITWGYTEEFIANVQKDYFQDLMTIPAICQKYEDDFPIYIINRTYKLIEMLKDEKSKQH